MMLALYQGLTRCSGPFLRLYLARRQARGKEPSERLPERLGLASRARPEGALVWLHGASVGEALSALPLIERLLAQHPSLSMLVTSGTVTSARILAERLPARAIHQFAPIDHPGYVARFLDHWRPDLALFVESELWPNLLLALKARGVPAALINARFSARSFRAWRRWRSTAQRLLDCFALILAQSAVDADRLQALGAREATVAGNLKHDAPALPVDRAALERLRQAIGERPLWLAASTHPGEEAVAAEAHERLKRSFPSLLTVIAPRHPERGAEIARALEGRGLILARRETGALPDRHSDVYLADTLGELGLFYRLSSAVFVGGSLVPHGGQNPLEPARLKCALLFGPHMHNFAREAKALIGAGAAREVSDCPSLVAELESLLRDPGLCERRSEAARAVASGLAGALDVVLERLAPLIDRAVSREPR